MMIERKPILMKTDVREKKDEFILDVDLPGCEREDIKTYLEDGYLVITAELNKSHEKEAEETEKGKLIRSERYSGSYSRSFYIGKEIHQDEIKATFKNGVLTMVVPKQSKHVPEKVSILIK